MAYTLIYRLIYFFNMRYVIKAQRAIFMYGFNFVNGAFYYYVIWLGEFCGVALET